MLPSLPPSLFLLPSPLFPRAWRIYKQTRLLQQVSQSGLGCHRFVPFHLVPLSSAPTDFFSLLSVHVLLSSCLFILILSFSCAHYRPDLSLYTYAHAYSTYSEVQVTQVRYNEVWLIGCPSSLGSFSSATTHTPLSVLSFSFSSVPFARTCAYLLSGQDGGHTCLPSGRRVCVTLGITGILSDCSRFWCFELFSRGTAWLVTVAVQRRGCYKSLIWILDAESTYLLGCGVDKLSLQSSRKGLVSSADAHGPPSSCRSIARWFL